MASDLNYNVGIDTSQAERSLQGLKNTLLGLGGAIAGAFAVRELVTVSSKFEDLRLTLQSLYRSAGQGSAVFNDIKEFAKSSAFAVDDLVQTVIKLKTAGLEPNIALLRLFADVSGSVADKLGALQAITDLYARTTAGGLGLEDLNRLADRGIPVFTILQEKLGLSRLEVSKIGQSAEGATLILKALETGLAETFGGAAASKANSLGQAMSNFKDVVNNSIDSLGRFGLNTALAKFINSLGDALQRLEPFVAIIGDRKSVV
jgi:phage tail tape-measure protein